MKIKNKYYSFISTKIITIYSPAVGSKEEAREWFDDLTEEQFNEFENQENYYDTTEVIECDKDGNQMG